MRILVVYETTLGRTKLMADAICKGAQTAGAECEPIPAREFKSLDGVCALALGSSTRMKRPLPKVREILSELGPLNGLPAASFGSYGWSGEAPDIISEHLRGLGAHMVDGQPLKTKEHPYEDALALCENLGKTLAHACGTHTASASQ